MGRQDPEELRRIADAVERRNDVLDLFENWIESKFLITGGKRAKLYSRHNMSQAYEAGYGANDSSPELANLHTRAEQAEARVREVERVLRDCASRERCSNNGANPTCSEIPGAVRRESWCAACIARAALEEE